MILLTETISDSLFLRGRLGESQAAHPHRLGMWGECILLCAWLLCARMLICVWIASQLVGLLNESSESCSWSLRARERGSVSGFLVWFASGIFLLLHGFTKLHFLPDSISSKNAVEFPCCTNLPGYSGSSFSSLFLHLHQVDTERRADHCCF